MAKIKSEKTLPKNTKSTKNRSRGFGDTLEKLFIFIGIKRLVKWFVGEQECGCDSRRDYLNEIFPYGKRDK